MHTIPMVYLSAINLTVNNMPKSLEWLTVPQISSYDLGQVAVRKFRVAKNSDEYIYFMVKVYVDEYGVLSTYAQTY